MTIYNNYANIYTFFNNLIDQPTTTYQEGNQLITIDEYEISWSRRLDSFEYRHHTKTGEVSFGDALAELVQQFEPILLAVVESIDNESYKIVINTSYGALHKGLHEPADDGIPARDIHDPYGFAVVLSYSGDKTLPGNDNVNGFLMVATTAWQFLLCNRELRGNGIQKMMDDDAAEALKKS